MSNIFLGFLLVIAFFAGFFIRNILKLFTGDRKNNQLVEPSEKCSASNADDSFHVFEKMKYYLASNDEDRMPALTASPSQDLGPQDLA